MIEPTIKATRKQPAPPAPPPPPPAPKPVVRPPVVKTDGENARQQVIRIIHAACKMLDVAFLDLGAKTRHKRVTLAREIITVVARRRTTRAYPAIAQDMGIRNHSTPITAANRHERIKDEVFEHLDVVRTRGEWARELETTVFPPQRSSAHSKP